MTSRNRRGAAAVIGAAAATAALLAGCSPSLDWREAHAEGSDVQLLFPCRPTQVDRRVPLAGANVKLSLMSCSAGSLTWGLAYADVADPARVDAALQALSASAAKNMGAKGAALAPQAIPGATPQARSGRLRLEGHLPDGKPVRMQALVFARGTVVFQASALGENLADETVDTFLASVRFPAQ
jgi:hypothetical protein